MFPLYEIRSRKQYKVLLGDVRQCWQKNYLVRGIRQSQFHMLISGLRCRVAMPSEQLSPNWLSDTGLYNSYISCLREPRFNLKKYYLTSHAQLRVTFARNAHLNEILKQGKVFHGFLPHPHSRGYGRAKESWNTYVERLRLVFVHGIQAVHRQLQASARTEIPLCFRVDGTGTRLFLN